MENKQHAINVINHENNNYLVYHPIVSKHLLRRLAANMLDFLITLVGTVKTPARKLKHD